MGAGSGVGEAAQHSRPHPARSTPPVPFYGPHQAGIATPTQGFVHFVALDMQSSNAGDLRALLTALSAAAAAIAAGHTVGPTATGPFAPVDTGEAIGLTSRRATVTFGVGPSIFSSGRFGLASKRPAPLVSLPSFAGDALNPQMTGGDIGIQVCADDPQVAFHAAHDLIRLASPTAFPRWSLAGFGNTSNSRAQKTPRNLMGFKDGTNNIKVEDQQAMNQFVWAGPPESPAWMNGGSYMVVRRIRMLFGHWDEVGLTQQEQIFGRHKVSGAPLGGVHEHDPVNLEALSHGQPVIPEDAHIRLASAAYNKGQRILRRGYSYTDGIDHIAGTVSGGLLFICFQRDPRAQFIPIQQRLAGEALGAHIESIGSAIFACPPGAHRGSFVGAGLFS